MIKYFIKHWLFTARWWLIGHLLTVGLFILAGWLFSNAATELFYVSLLSGTLFVLTSSITLWKDYRHCQESLQHLTEAQQPDLDMETSYLEQQLWRQLESEKRQRWAVEQQHKAHYHEQLDYYTLWAHQIKTPISAATLLTEQLPSDSPIRPLLNQELFKIQQYSDFVLNYLRMGNFHQDLRLQNESLQPIVNELIKKYAAFFIHKHLQIELINLDYPLITDRKWLSLLLEQLLSNAIKYTNQGTITFRMDGSTLSIQDTGIGIQADDLPRIFERGFTGYNGHFSQQSSGLGLYLTKEIARQLGYPLTVTSKVGQGTCFSLDLTQAKIAQD